MSVWYVLVVGHRLLHEFCLLPLSTSCSMLSTFENNTSRNGEEWKGWLHGVLMLLAVASAPANSSSS